MSGPILIPLELVLAIGFGIDIVLAILGVNVFKIIRNRFARAVPKVR